MNRSTWIGTGPGRRSTGFLITNGRADNERTDVDYTERLRCLTINDIRLGETDGGEADFGSGTLDQKSLTLARLAALIAVGGAPASYGAQTDAAIGAGATTNEIVDVLVGVIPVVGLPRVVAAAPKLALALGYDMEEALQYQAGD